MNIKKIFMLLLMIPFLGGCVNVNNLSYDDISEYFNNSAHTANIYEVGYKFYKPYGMSVENAGDNYVILEDNYTSYYLYVDLLNYINDTSVTYDTDSESLYSKTIDIDGKKGYITIKLWENEKYLIEIVYNYAKIEVMVDESMINKALINSINILNSVCYNDDIIINLLNDNKLNYTEEEFDFFEDVESGSSNYLDYADEEDIEEEVEEEIVDTDFIN